MNQNHLTDEHFWTDIWNRQRGKVRHLRWVYVANRQLARLFQHCLGSFKHPRVLEVGCADSLWLPFLAQNYPGDIYGIDFSELGCQLSRRNLERKGATATVICQDFFDFAKEQSERFDFVYSMGVIEHFNHPTEILQEMYHILKPGGRMLTVFPNLRGIYTPIARIASPKLLEKHKVITPPDIKSHLQSIDFRVTEVGFTGGALKLSVVDYSPWRATIGTRGHEILCKLVNLTDVIVANLLAALRVPNQQLTSPYVYAISEKPM